MSDRIAYELIRFRTRDGGETTVYLVRHPLADTRVSVRLFAEPERLDVWCRAEGVAEALVAGFFVGHLLNRPYSNHDQPAPQSRPVVTALLFGPAG